MTGFKTATKTVAIRRLALVGVALILGTGAASAQSPAFVGLGGAWSGTGTISLSDGAKERIRCKASYVVGRGDARLQQSLRCASDSYRFDLTSDLVSQQGQIAGSVERSQPRHQRHSGWAHRSVYTEAHLYCALQMGLISRAELQRCRHSADRSNLVGTDQSGPDLRRAQLL